MSGMIRVAAIAVMISALALSVKKSSAEMAFLMELAAMVTVLFMAASAMEEILRYIRDAAAWANMDADMLAAVLKAAGIAVITRLSSDIFRDAGQQAAATAADLAGSCAAMAVTFPLVASVLEKIGGAV